MNLQDVLAFSRLFLSVDDRHRRELQEMTGPPRDLYERVISTYTHISQPALESLLPSKDRLVADFNELRSYIYFRAIQEDQIAGFLLPVVSLRYAFNTDPVEVRI